MPDQLEIELKFAVADAAAMRSTLAELGAESHGRYYETNIRLDNALHMLTSRYITLRVRTTHQSEEAQHVVTVKTPASNQDPAVRVRREIEFSVDDDQAVIAALEVLGYQPIWRYEKFRENFTLGQAEVCLDETPIGVFVEIEGASEAIAQAARDLSLSMEQGLFASYAVLFQFARDQLKFKAVDMTFDALGDIHTGPDFFMPIRQVAQVSESGAEGD